MNNFQTMVGIQVGLAAIAITQLCVPGSAFADEVFLKNGDRISGTVISKTGDVLLLDTKYAGEIKINWADVSGMSTDQSVRIQLDDETLLQGTVSTPGENSLEVTGETAATRNKITLDQVEAINPPVQPDFTITGQANFGAVFERGNTDEDNLHLDAESIFRWPDDRVTVSFDGDFENTNDETTKQEFDLIGNYDHFLNEKLYLNSGLSFEHDEFADLDLRTTLSAGVGYQFFDDDRTFLSIQGGPAYVWENFDVADDQEYLAGLWALRYSYFLYPEWKLQFFHNHRITQSLESFSDYIFKSKTGLRVPVFDNFQTTIRFDFDRDNSPGAGADKNDYKYLLTAGYGW